MARPTACTCSLDQPANLTNSQILAMVSGSQSGELLRSRHFVRGYNGVSSGNHVATVITYEPTGNYNIQRFAGLLTQTNLGLGFGDMNATNTYTTTDIRCSGACSNNSVEDVLYSQNSKFRAAFDVNGDGLGDNRDLFLLGQRVGCPRGRPDRPRFLHRFAAAPRRCQREWDRPTRRMSPRCMAASAT